MGLFKYIANADSRRALRKLDKQAKIIEDLEPKYAAMSDEELKGQTAVLKDRLAKGETLDDILYDAFAALREASWRVLKMKHFHVQIIGGICLHQGRIAEMKTGEGKTLVSTLPAYLNALTGKGVHIVTVNDYLAKRDAEWMGKVHKFMGLTVGVVVPGMDDKQKKEAYQCDIIYATNNELGFDYLRDNLKTSIPAMVQRELNYCIIDEIDSILIDEARTPLIISGKGGESSQLYVDVDRFVRTLHGGFDDDKKAAETRVPVRKKKGQEFTEEEKKVNEQLAAILKDMEDWDYIIDRKDKSVTITENGAKKAEKFFNIKNLGDIENADLNHHIQQALKAHELFARDENYIVTEDGEIMIVDEFTGRLMVGRRYSDGLHQAIEAKEHVKVREENKTHATVTFQNYFRLYSKLSGMTGTAKTEEAEFRTIYSLDVVCIPTNRPVARIDYPDKIFSTVESKKKAIVQEVVERHANGQPILIGTVTVDRSEEISRLLRRNGIKHNILNAKNHAREAEIVAQAGRFGAVTIATNMAGRGTDILLGGNPEYLAKKRMREEGYDHDMIEVAISYADRPFTEEEQTARKRYADLYAMYKAETDAEKEKVIEAGGLCIIGTERHDSRRIDNQLRGRAGRQGDPGASVFFISLEDDLAKRFGGEKLKALYSTLMDEDDCLQSKMLSRSIENAQMAIEGRNFGARKHTLQYDEVMNEQRKLIYSERLNVLRGGDVHDQMLKYIPDYVAKVLRETVNTEAMPELWNEEALNAALKQKVYPDECQFEITREMLEKWDYEYAVEKITKEVTKAYEQKIENISRETHGQVDYHQVERNELLRAVDRNWIDHIDAMDQLRKGIGLRGYAQQDPVIAYKQEGHEMFEEMIERIQTITISRLLKGKIIRVPAAPPRPARPAQGGMTRLPNGMVVRQGQPLPGRPAAQNAQSPAGQGGQQAPAGAAENSAAPAAQGGEGAPGVQADKDGNFVPENVNIHRPKKD
ncbi:MAG TPA: preprotein translocase subunit SecA [Candidatus Coproplasma avicola]|uniref:Protein translocase subunit SecA n=1 Tax=Candidatus Coproplasma avicola TaxID=2840744 RepID=A0A9D1E7C2_9FIRM|nr:preprotein translocase subunit SecA [Candidatus Coproplasma avicola]